MTPDADGFLDEAAPKGVGMERVRALSAGAKLVVVAGFMLFFSLFLTWQNLEIDYGTAGTGTQMLDGWDIWGLLIGFLTLGLVSLVLVVYAPDLELDRTFDWELLIFVLAIGLLGLTIVKNLTDADSAWPSYFAVLLAGVVVAGAFVDWSVSRFGRRSALRRPRRRRRIRSAA